MRKIAFDLGSASIGWVITDNGVMLKKGVVRFSTGMNKGQAGYVSPTRERRESRSKRNLIRTKKYRKWELLKILISGGFVPLTNGELDMWSKYQKGVPQKFPENKEFLKWLACNFIYEDGLNYRSPYELRVKALNNQLSKHEFGRVLFHLVQRRGYKDIGDKDEETKKQIERREGEAGFQQALQKNDGIISKALLNEFLNKNKRARNQYPYRDEYRYELEEICKGQGYDVSKEEEGYYKDEFVEKLWKAIIWQQDLKSQKGNIGKCILEPKKTRCPISHPVFEVFRAWSFINTIKYYDDNDEKQFIPQKIRKDLFNFFLNKDRSFKFEEIRVFLDKKLKVAKSYNYPINKDVTNKNEIYKDGVYETSVSGMPVCKGLIDIFGEKYREELDIIELQNATQKEKNGGFGSATKIVNKYSIFDLWHILFVFDEKTTKEKEFLSKFAKEKLSMTDNKQIEKFAKLKNKFQQGYSDISLNVMCKIIPFLKEGYLYNEAVVLAKMPDILGDSWEDTKVHIIAVAKEANHIYEWRKNVVSITNTLIDKFKGLKEDEVFGYKNFEYMLDDSGDQKDVLEAIQRYFGDKRWETKKDKKDIIEAVKIEYQAFFYDEKRTYRNFPTLTNVFNEKLKDKGIIIDSKKLYHHSNTGNIYLKQCKTDKELDNPILPKANNKYGIEVDVLPGVLIDSIKNPMFNKSMSVLRRLINELIKNELINERTEVIVEVASDLNDNNMRIAIERFQRERETNRDKYRQFLVEFKEHEKLNFNVEKSIRKFELWTEQIFDVAISKDDNNLTVKDRHDILKENNALKRYELWREQKGLCMYTGDMISIGSLFSSEIEIEHTIPRSILPDNTLANQTVCYARYNRSKKNNRIPTQCDNFYKDVDGWGSRIEARLQNWKEIRDNFKSKYKKNLRPFGSEDEDNKNRRIQNRHFFKMHYDYWRDKIERFEAKEVKDGWVRRQLVDTQMVSKYARQFLKTYFLKVSVQKGIVTSIFRKLYGIQDEDEIKNRNRHTHHAIDALVLTLIPTNSSYRERILKEYFVALESNNKEAIRKLKNDIIPNYVNIQKLISEIENTTLVYSYKKDAIIKQTRKIVRKRGKKQYLKDKSGDFILNENGDKILLLSQGNTVRSNLFAQTYLGKIKDVERDESEQEIRIEKLNLNLKVKGLAKRTGDNWSFKSGKDEFVFVKRESIDKVKGSSNLISLIVDPVIRELVSRQRANSEIKDYQGNVIRHVRIHTKSGREVKERINYLSYHEHKNKFYSTAGSIPYAVLLQNFNNGNVDREMISLPSFEIAKMYRDDGRYNIPRFVKKYYSQFKGWNMDLLKVGQRVFVLNEDLDYEKRNNIEFQKNRLYIISKFGEDSIWLEHHLNALSENEVKNAVDISKDEILCRIEKKYDIPLVVENTTIVNDRDRKDDYEKRKFSFNSIGKDYRLKRLSTVIGVKETRKIKKELDKYKVRSSKIEIEGNTHFLKMSKQNWSFLIEGKDFDMNMDGTIMFKYE